MQLFSNQVITSSGEERCVGVILFEKIYATCSFKDKFFLQLISINQLQKIPILLFPRPDEKHGQDGSYESFWDKKTCKAVSALIMYKDASDKN